MIANTYVVKPFGISEVKVIALKGEPGGPTQEQVNTAVEEYMDDHPEAQIPDGAVTTEKLASNAVAPYADNLVSSSYVSDSEPYLFRKTFAGVREDTEIVGGSVVWNQLIDVTTKETKTSQGITYTNNGDGSFTLTGTPTSNNCFENINYVAGVNPYILDHVYMMDSGYNGTEKIGIRIYGMTSVSIDARDVPIIRKADQIATNGYVRFQVGDLQNTDIGTVKLTPQMFDLTLMFGSTVADYIYSLEQATTGAGVIFFRSLFDKPYYPYNAGEIISVNTSAHKMVGKNQIEIGSWSTVSSGALVATHNSDGSITVNGTTQSTTILVGNLYTGAPLGTQNDQKKHIKSGNYVLTTGLATSRNIGLQLVGSNGTSSSSGISIIKTAYTSTIVEVDDTYAYNWIRVAVGAGTYDNVIIYPMMYLASVTDSTYEPYTEVTYPLSSIDLRGIPTISDGKLKYDGDVYKADGTVERRYGIVDLGTRTWSYNSTGAYFYCDVGGKALGNWNIRCSMYSLSSSQFTAGMQDKEIKGNASSNSVFVKDSAYTDAATFKTAMSGVYLVYELATPTTETADPYTNPQVCYPDGTEEYIDTRDVPIPVGHNTKYMRDLKKLLEGIPDAPSANGTYVLKATVSSSGVTYAWIAG